MNTVIVTGVSKGLGAALVVELLEHGYHVMGIGRTPHPSADHPNYQFVSWDLSDPNEIHTNVVPALQGLQGLSSVSLVNNAAVLGECGTLGTLDHGKALQTYNVNQASPLFLSDVFCKTFQSLEIPKSLIHISSGLAFRSMAGATLYCQTKSGLEMMSRCINDEQAGKSHPIKSICVSPGIIDTAMQAEIRSQSAETLPQVQMFHDYHAEGKLVQPEDVAKTFVQNFIQGSWESGKSYRLDGSVI